MLSKECKHCKENKSLDKFHANKKGKFGVHSVCKVCKNKRDAERLGKDKPRMARNYKKYIDNNPHAKIAQSLRRRMRKVLNGTLKCEDTFKLLGCSTKDWKIYLESKFLNCMNWDNYGEWHIDHIIPCAAFDLTKPENQKKCFHYSNTQPLWAKDNLRKGDKYVK